MKKILTSLMLTATIMVQACWFTSENFNGNYIAGVNNFIEHYTPVSSFSSAIYHNGGSASLPLTVYVRVTESKLTSQQGTVLGQIQIAILQYKVKHNNTWGKWKTVFQMIMTGLMIANIEVLQILTDITMWIALALTIISLLDYLWKNRKVMQEVK